PATLEPGAMVENADEARCLWQFEGQQGQFVALALDAVEPGADPTLSLLDEGGALLVYNDDSPAGLNPRLVALLPADGHYFVKVDWVSGPGPFTLSLTQLQPEALAIGDVITSAGPEQQAWQFTGLAGDRLTIAMDASDPDGDPLLALYDESGGLIGYELGGGAGPNARLHVALPQDGTYLVEADWESQAGAYSLAIEPAETRELSLPETTVEAEPDQWSWQFRGNAGTLVAIAMDALEEGGDPRLRLYDENGDFLAENDDENESSLDALLQFVLPSTGVYYVDAGWTTNPGRYRLTLSQSTQEVDLQDIAQASL